jgi:hypothetical protein
MIALYEFDNANPAGDKEAVVVPAIPTLINKLSANETNGIRDKINEIITVGQTHFTNIAYLELRLKFKGIIAGVPNTLVELQPGDIVHGFADANTIWTNARYEGGDINDRNNYTPLYEPKQEPILITATATGINQTFILPNGYAVGSVLKSKGELFKGTEWTQTSDILTILVNVNTGNTIYLKPQ